MSMVEIYTKAFTECYSGKFTEFFSGRSTRAEYWYFVLFNFIIQLALAAAGVCFVLFSMNKTAGNVLSSLYSLALFLPETGLMVRRMRDAGFHWGWCFIGLVPIIGWIALIVMLCMPSKDAAVEETKVADAEIVNE